MFDELVADILRFSHLLAIAVGFGVAVETEIFMLRRRNGAISRGLLSGVEHRHRVILYSLGAMWVTGMALVALRTGFQLSAFTPKLWAKISVVSILTVNAFFISEIAMPILANHAGRRISQLPLTARRALFAVAGISATSWLVAMALGSSALLKVSPAWLFQSALPVAYIAGVLAANLVGQHLYGPNKARVHQRPKTAKTTHATARPKPPQAAVTLQNQPQPVAADAPPKNALSVPKVKAPPPPEQPNPAPATAKVAAPMAKPAKKKRPAAPQVEVRASDLAIAFPPKLKRNPRLKVDPVDTPERSAAKMRLAEVAAELNGRG